VFNLVGKNAFIGTALLKFRSFSVELWNETSIFLGTRNGTKAENRERGTSEDCSSLGEVRAAKLYTAVNLHPSAAIRSSLGYRKKKVFLPRGLSAKDALGGRGHSGFFFPSAFVVMSWASASALKDMLRWLGNTHALRRR